MLELSRDIIKVSNPELLKAFDAKVSENAHYLDSEGADDLLDDVFIGLFDSLLDSVDTFSDEQTGSRHVPTLVVSKVSAPSADGAKVDLIYGRNIPRPQVLFPDHVDNFPHGPWIPRITEKPNATVPLSDVFQEFNDILKEHEEARRLKLQAAAAAAKNTSTTAPAKSDSGLPQGISSHIASLGVSAQSGIDRSTSPFLEDGSKGSGNSSSNNDGFEDDEDDEDAQEEVALFPHPYQYELDHLEYPAWVLKAGETQMYGALAETPVTWVGTSGALAELAAKLAGERAIAIDLEAHSLRSYEGFTCLMQVSTRTEDFLVDTLALRGQLGAALNPVFTNPLILKVLHGCDWDVLWLQRDFGLYVVNCFDTGQAARVLGLPSFALKYLLQLYCNVEADKRYQLADWRIRPLPPEMFDYARGDTHYLLYVYDRMKADLLARTGGAPTLLAEVLDRSRRICLSRYRPTPPPTAAAARKLLMRDKSQHGPFSRLQTAVLVKLVKWRDTLARREDESVRYILPNHMLLRVAEMLPTTTKDLIKTCNPVPIVFNTNGEDVIRIVKAEKKAQDELAAHLPTKVLPPMPDHPTHTVFPSESDNDANDDAPKDEPAKDDTNNSNANNNGVDLDIDDDEVLTADQLYKMAGWEEKNDVDMDEPAKEAKTNAQAVKSSALFDDSSDDEDINLDVDVSGIGAGGAGSKANVLINPAEFPPLTATFQEKKEAKDSGDDDDDDDDGNTVTTIPKTMEEIYKLSNANRKRNKEKRKLKEETGKLHSNDDDSDNDEPDQKTPNTSSSSSSTAEDKHEFMKKIGWIESNGANEASAAESAPADSDSAGLNAGAGVNATQQKQGIRIERRKPGNGQSGPKKLSQQQQQKQFAGYDYSKVNSASVSSSFGLGGNGGKPQPQQQQHHQQRKKDKTVSGPKQPSFGTQKEYHTPKFQRGVVSQSFSTAGSTGPAVPAWKK